MAIAMLEEQLRHASPFTLERAHVVAQSLALLGLPAFLIDFQGRVLAANEPMVEKWYYLRWLATGRIAFRDRAANASLKQALHRFSCNATFEKYSFPARAEDSDDVVVVHVIPVRRMARDDLGENAAMIVLSLLRYPKAPPISLIQSIFGLSPCEARVAQGLSIGATLDELAAEAHVSRNTVRSQLRVVLEKTAASDRGKWRFC